MCAISIAAEAADAGTRLDVFWAARADVTRSRAERLIAEGRVTVNGAAAPKRYRLCAGDFVHGEVPLPEPCLTAAPEAIPLDIVYEDADLVVVNKPRGMVVHPAPGHTGGTLVNALLYHCRDLSGINGTLRPGIVHRLDKDTSGLLLVAKNDRTHQALAAQLADRSMGRVYHGLAQGRVKRDVFAIDRPIARHPQDRKRMAVRPDSPAARTAVTHVAVLERFAKATLFEARLETGRTHQIRVHMAHIGHPLVGDAVYGSGGEGQVLHAKTLRFVHPSSGSEITLDSDWPDWFAAAVEPLLGSHRIL